MSLLWDPAPPGPFISLLNQTRLCVALADSFLPRSSRREAATCCRQHSLGHCTVGWLNQELGPATLTSSPGPSQLPSVGCWMC